MKYPWLYEELGNMPGAVRDFKEEWQWTRFQVGGKLFAAICKDGEGQDELLTLKLEPAEGRFLREQYEDVIPGYYMNKEHWNSIQLEGAVPEELVRELIGKSYRLVLGGLSKKKQKEIAEGMGQARP